MEEIKPVVKLEVGEAKQTLKDIKKGIDDMRASLFSMEKGTDEYNKKAKEVTDAQNKFNEVMKVGKDYADAAEGSYNALVKQMADLKKQWRATANEVERADLGQKILEINDQLKELDASTGNFQRNVGDYANAFEQAFEKCMDGVSTLPGAVGEIGNVTKQLLPVIKSINTTATKGLAGIKKALISTGIGAIVVAVGLLAANFDKVLAVVKKLIPSLNKAQAETDKIVAANKQMVEVNITLSAQIDYQSRLMEAQGASIAEVTAYKRAETQAILDNVRAQIQETQAKIANMKAHSKMERFFKGENKQIKELEESIATLEEEEKNLANTITKINQDETISNARAQTEAARKAAEDARAAAQAKKQAAQDSKDADEQAAQAQLEADKKEIESIKNRIAEASKTEIQKLTEKYNQEKALLIEYGESTLALTKEYEEKVQAIKDKAAEDAAKAEAEKLAQEAEAKKAEYEKKVADINRQQLGKDNDANQASADYGVNSKEAYIERLEAAQFYYDSLSQLEFENEEQRRQAVIAAERDITQIKREYQEQQINNYLTMASSIGSIFSSIADFYESDIQAQVDAGKITEEEGKKKFELVKKMQAATATIEMLQGITAAVSGLFTTKSGPWDIALAATQAATIAASGIANIKKIKETQFGSSSTSSPDIQTASVSAPTVEYTPQYTATMTGLNEQSSINSGLSDAMQGVNIWVDVSEISNKQDSIKTKVSESTF